jgi:hypothetical protein
MRPRALLRACGAALLSAVPLSAWQTLEVGGPTAVTADRCVSRAPRPSSTIILRTHMLDVVHI